MAEEIEIVQLVDGDPVTAGSFVLDNGELTARPKPGKEQLFRNLLTTDAMLMDGTFVAAKEDPKLWFQELPRTFSGSYLCACKK